MDDGPYTTTSGFPTLNGSCVLNGSDCESYNSNTLGPATNVQNQGGPFLSFVVQWNNVNPVQTYRVSAGPDPAIDGWSGNADNGNDKYSQTEEPWAATAVTVEPAAAAKGTS